MSTVAQIQIPQGSGIPPVSSSGSPRNIAAPYQTQTTTSPMKGVVAGTPPRSLPTHLAPGNKVDTVDYRSFQFQELESAQVVAFDKYCGPTPESNWVVPGKLLVGAYPASNDDGETLDLITSILRWGITKFVCLQQEVSFPYFFLLQSYSDPRILVTLSNIQYPKPFSLTHKYSIVSTV